MTDVEVTKAALLDLLNKIRNFKGTEAEINMLILEFEQICLHPDGSDLIYYPSENREWTDEEVAEKAMSYIPPRLG